MTAGEMASGEMVAGEINLIDEENMSAGLENQDEEEMLDGNIILNKVVVSQYHNSQ